MTKIDETALEAAANAHGLGYAERAMFRIVPAAGLAFAAWVSRRAAKRFKQQSKSTLPWMQP
jgi:hypothetical protein